MAPSEQATSEPHGSALRTLGFVSLGTGGAALGGALAFEILRRNDADRANHETQQVRFADDVRAANAHQTDARALAGVGAGLAVLGAAFLLFAPSGMPTGADHATRMRVDVGAASVRANLFGTF